jgi:methylenetetrahydrofolate dehydrogenase (NADP+)/methenyltetrahydrofolate cyclohydrolase
MTALRIDGIALAAKTRAAVAQRAKAFEARLGRPPGLTVVVVGDNPASAVYVRNKVKACDEAGFRSEKIALAQDCSESMLLETIDRLNQDDRVDGILVQLPLPPQINAHRVIEAIAAEKDVDGFHVANAGALMIGEPLFRPCTPYGVMKLLEEAQVSIRGAEAVILGASNIVGKPMAMLLLQAGATVTLCNSKTRSLADHTRRADILVAAVGRPHLVTADMVKPGAVVIDVGINRLDDGRLAGDVDTEAVSAVASAITPVPGGVGPMTIAMLLVNTMESAERKLT